MSAALETDSRMPLVRRETRDGAVALVTLDRPRANAFSPELVSQLREAIRESEGAAAVVLASSQKIFSGGWDLRRISLLERAEMADFVRDYTDLIRVSK